MYVRQSSVHPLGAAGRDGRVPRRVSGSWSRGKDAVPLPRLHAASMHAREHAAASIVSGGGRGELATSVEYLGTYSYPFNHQVTCPERVATSRMRIAPRATGRAHVALCILYFAPARFSPASRDFRGGRFRYLSLRIADDCAALSLADIRLGDSLSAGLRAV